MNDIRLSNNRIEYYWQMLDKCFNVKTFVVLNVSNARNFNNC